MKLHKIQRCGVMCYGCVFGYDRFICEISCSQNEPCLSALVSVHFNDTKEIKQGRILIIVGTEAKQAIKPLRKVNE